jgi:hypothetical protein
VGANNADLRALARAILSKSRGALEARTAAGQVSHAAYAAGTGEDSQIQAHNPAVPLSHALGLGQRDTSASKPKSVGGTPAWDTNGTVGQPYGVVLTALRKGCPEMVDAADWLQALRDAESFVLRWGTQAHGLGWTARELFGLHPVPQYYGPTYRRLSRYDATGLIWLLRGRPVVALSASAAEIQGQAGAITRYRKHLKPALGPRVPLEAHCTTQLPEQAGGWRESASSD